MKNSTNSILFTYDLKEQENNPEDEMLNQTIFNKYEVRKKCGKTSTINIYEGVEKENNKPIIIKIEKMKSKSDKKLFLEDEAYNLYSFKGFGIPALIKLGKRNNNIVLIEEKKGKSLYELFMENNKKFSLNEICLIGIQCIERLEWIHSKCYVHRNIKPENFVIGLDDPHVIYLQNFYLCQKYKSSKTNQHIKLEFTKEIVGTERYGSINSLRGLVQSRKDDLESLCYMLIYFFLGKLPWQGIRTQNQAVKYEILLKMKKNFKIEMYNKIPKDFCTLFKYVKNLKFNQEPKYNLMIKLLQNILDENQLFNNKQFHWIKDISACHGANIKARKDGPRKRMFEKISKKTNSENISDFEKRKVLNSDVDLNNLGDGYIYDEEESKEDKVYNEKSAYQIKFTHPLFNDKSENKEEEEGEDDNNNIENDLNCSNSSINTKVYKLNATMESLAKEDIKRDEESGKIDDPENKNKKSLTRANTNINISDKLNYIYNDVIKEEPLKEDEDNYIEDKNEINVNNKEGEAVKTITSYDKNKIGSFLASNITYTNKQDSTQESIQVNNKESQMKNNNKGTVIIIKDSDKKEDTKK